MKGRTRTQYLKRLQKYQKCKQRRTKKQQSGGFLNKYDFFSYAGTETFNQAMEGLGSLAPKLIKQTLKEVDKIGEARIRQVINDGGQEIQKIAPQIIPEATEDVYKVPFTNCWVILENKIFFKSNEKY